MKTVLIVDDKEMLRDSIAVTLQRAGFTVVSAPDGPGALELIPRKRPDAVITDLRMPGMSGLDLIKQIRDADQDLPVVLMTAFGTIKTAVEAMKIGAFDYITKPFEGDELVIAVKRAIEHARLKRDNAILRLNADSSERCDATDADAPCGLDRILGESHAIRQIKEKIRDIAASHGTVLISGESGTGKEVVARTIHDLSPRVDEPFLAMNCAAMSESLMESELFGHERGAFTGADQLRKGRFELAHSGSLLLDEISEIQPHIQAKLLRVLQERTFERVGSSTPIGVDVRVIATTNRTLPEEVSKGEFREDLYFRLNVLPIELPPLRDRIDDVEILAPHFVRAACRRDGRHEATISTAAMSLLKSYHWPGNVRELQNLCERAVVLSRTSDMQAETIGRWLFDTAPPPTPTIRATGFATATRTNGNGSSNGNGTNGHAFAARTNGGVPAVEILVNDADRSGEPKPLADIEREVIVETLKRYNGHRQKTARALGIGVRTLGLKLKKWKELQLVSPTL